MAQDVYHHRKKKSSVVIIGNGMVAGALKNLTGWHNDVFFSSGVSNSGERSEDCYKRELDLLRFHLGKVTNPSFFIYFSTTSIFDPAKMKDPYILHKLNIENIIRSSKKNYMILRLPNLVGLSKNPNTLTNYFADCIRENRQIKLNGNAVRHLIDVDDLSFILNDIKRTFGKIKMTVNVETDRPLPAQKILSMIEESMQRKAVIHSVDENEVMKRRVVHLKAPQVNYFWKTNEHYHINLLKKYYSC